MKTFHYTIKDAQGIHARPAGELVKLVNGLSSKVTIEKAGKVAEAKRLFAIMGLAVKAGDEITIGIDGGDEEGSAAMVQKFFEENL